MTKTQSSEYQMLQMALVGYEYQREGIIAQIGEIQSMLRGAPAVNARVRTPEQRKCMADAQKARYAKARKAAMPVAKYAHPVAKKGSLRSFREVAAAKKGKK